MDRMTSQKRLKEARLEIEERDCAGNITATYVTSGSKRIDVLKPQGSGTLLNQLWQYILDVFLPVGYPNSVTKDYLEYMFVSCAWALTISDDWQDSLQAFSSSIAGLLSSRAVLEGVGVGDAEATPTAALLLTIVQSSIGRVATILFAYRLGSALEPECKMWRLTADIFNDTAMILDCLSPIFPRTARILILSASSTMRALCGVAAGSAKASLSAHFAKWGNLGELNAKDSSQETVISLLGMLAGSAIVGLVTTPVATWLALIFLISVHLLTNHAAVRAVSMHTFNRQRANIAFSTLLDDGKVLSPLEVSKRERIFEKDGVLRWKSGRVMGRARLGVTLSSLVSQIARRSRSTGSFRQGEVKLLELTKLFKSESYILWYSPQQKLASIVLTEDATPKCQLKAWTHALLLAKWWESLDTQGQVKDFRLMQEEDSAKNEEDSLMRLLQLSLQRVNECFEHYTESLKEEGWDFEASHLETISGTRIRLETHDLAI